MENVNPTERTKGSPPPAEANGQGSPDQPAAAPLERGSLGDGIMWALLALFFFFIIRMVGLEGLGSAALVALGLGFVIFVHELGHFLVAKWCDVHVETFSIGFGPSIPGCSFRRGETLYKIAWVPLGGYVKMVGEGEDGDEESDDPRSFKNKTVWQRMAIISAGVVMNIILGFLCFIFVFETHGIAQDPAVVSMVDPGGPAWQKGVPTGAVIKQIGDIQNPYFEDLRWTVTGSRSGEKLPLVYETPDHPGRLVETELEPRSGKEDMAPVIGVMMPRKLELLSPSRKTQPPVVPGSPASRATPAFEPGDRIIATTDPNNSGRVTPLPDDPRNTQAKQPDYFEFERRQERLAGIPMVMRVERKSAPPGSTPVDITVPPAFHSVFGMRMRMGQIAAVRHDSPAARVGVRARDPDLKTDGDILEQVEVAGPDGRKIRWVLTRKADEPAPTGVDVRELDPVRLPFELGQWARSAKGPKDVVLTVLRQVAHAERGRVELKTAWDDRWDENIEAPFYVNSPLSIAGLGLAYRVEAIVDAVEPGKPADKAGLRRGDIVRAIRFNPLPEEGSKTPPAEWNDLKDDQWAHVFWTLQNAQLPIKDLSFRVERDKQTIEMDVQPEPDPTWPLVERGLLLMPDRRVQKATSLGNAVYLGMQRTYRSVVNIYLNLRAMMTGRISLRATGGPIMIAAVAFQAASDNLFALILFLGMISVNLAVINFLPIPLLDGGHMVFLIYEKLRGAPASESVRVIATYVGLAFILGLMVFAFWNDLSLFGRRILHNLF